MEQLQTVLAVVKKHHFWILAGLVFLIALVIYTMASGAIKKEYQSRKSTIEGALQKAQSVSNEENHPNQQKIDNWKVLCERQRLKVLESWETLYQKQQKENPWPSVLSREFLDRIREIGPTGEIPTRYREQYRNFIKNELPKLFELVNYRHYVVDEETTGTTGGMPRQPGGAAPGMDAMGTQQNTKQVGVVDWAENDRQTLMMRYDFQSNPTTTEVRMAQEDYWVYQALLNIIKSTNGDAKTQNAAAVKEIEILQIGQDAAASIQSDQGADLLSGLLQNTGSGMGGGMNMGMGGEMGMGMGGGMGMPGGGMGMGMPGGEMGMGGGMGMPSGGMGMGMPGGEMGMGAGGMGMPGGDMGMGGDMSGGMGGDTSGGPALTQADMILLMNRYVDESLKPLPANSSPYAEFKMMPIYMRLKVDQRKIPDLLVECANSTMPVEVKQLRINPESGGSFGGGGMGMGTPARRTAPVRRSTMGGGMGMPGGGMGMGEMGMGMGMPGAGGRPMGGMGGAAGEAVVDENPYIVSIEIRGIIYIYNPPDKTKLATGSIAEQAISGTPVGATSEGTVPVNATMPAEGTTPETQTPPTGATTPTTPTPVTPATETPAPEAPVTETPAPDTPVTEAPAIAPVGTAPEENP